MGKYLVSTRRHLPGLLLSLSFALGGCDKPQPLGNANSIIVAATDSDWAEIEAEMEQALEPRHFTVRDERIFELTQVDPTSAEWGNLQRFRQVLLVGEPGDPWVAEALQAADVSPSSLPTVVHAEDVWSTDQRVTAVVTPLAAGATAVVPLLDEVAQDYLRRFHEYTIQRMYTSGVDSALADTLRREAGFSLLLPEVYYGGEVAPNVYVYRNDYPDPSDLIRSVLVAWRPDGETAPTAESALAWRDEIAERQYDSTQVRDTAQVRVDELGGAEGRGIEVQGVWTSPPGAWPGAGPFITRLVECPEQQREYLLDAWLYAPGTSKYEYLLQLQTILNTFTCGQEGTDS